MNDLVPIGRFSTMTRLSVKALRHYADLGILEPAWIDPATGYRHYRQAQANRAEAIRVLRAVDMPLHDIRVLLDADPDAVGARLREHRARLADRLAEQERMLAYLEELIDRDGGVLPYEVTLQDIERDQVAALRLQTDLASIGGDIGSGFATIMRALHQAGTAPSGAPFIVFHDVIDEETEGEIEICVPVPDGATGRSGPVDWKAVPAMTVAATTHRGAYAEVGPAYHTVAGWIEERGHQISGPPREVYLNDPQQVPPEELMTEVRFPVEVDG